MSFHNPGLLYFLWALIIPVIIHLFNFRRYRTLSFSSVQFLKEIKQDNQSKTQLKHWLILLSRILFFAAIIIAFANPFIPSNDEKAGQSGNQFGLYIDNSFSMIAESGSGSILELAKAQAQRLVEASPANSEWFLITNDFETKHLRMRKAYQLPELIQEIQASGMSRTLPDITNRFQQLAKDQWANPSTQLTVFTDAQGSFFTGEFANPDSSLSIRIFPLPSVTTGNLSIDSCWFEQKAQFPGQPANLQVLIRNYANQAFNNVPIQLFLNDTLASIANVSIEANDTAVAALSFNHPNSTWVNGRIELEDFPVIFDNQLFFSYEVKDHYRILIISEKGENEYLENLFLAEDYFQVTQFNAKTIDFSRFSEFDLLILDELVSLSPGLVSEGKAFLAEGGRVVLIPSPQTDLMQYNLFLEGIGAPGMMPVKEAETQADPSLLEHPYLKAAIQKTEANIQLPRFKHYYQLQSAPNNANEWMVNRLKQPLLLSIPYQNGTFFEWAVPLHSSKGERYTHPLMLPLFYQIALADEASFLQFGEVGREANLRFKNASNVNQLERIRFGTTERVVVPMEIQGQLVQVYNEDPVLMAGNYNYVSDDSTVFAYSWNYNRSESNPEVLTEKEINDRFNSLGFLEWEIIDSKNDKAFNQYLDHSGERSLWKYFLMAALFFLIMEGLLVWYFSRARS